MGQKYLLSIACILALCWCGPAQAFPDNGVLDTFTGTDNTSPPNANWTNAELRAGLGGCDIEDNAVAPSNTGGLYGCYWNAATFGPDAEAYATIANIGSSSFFAICARITTPGASDGTSNTTDGYCVEAQDGAAVIGVYRLDNATPTLLGASISQTIATTDKIGIKIVGDQVCAWFSDSGGAWTQLACRTDATYSASGFLALYLVGDTGIGALDDFGGGTIGMVSQMRRRLE